MAAPVLSFAPLTEDNYVNNLFFGAKEELQCNKKDILITTSNYTEMRITENLQVVIILFIIFKAIKARNAMFIV